jgi:hypothetical protein
MKPSLPRQSAFDAFGYGNKPTAHLFVARREPRPRGHDGAVEPPIESAENHADSEHDRPGDHDDQRQAGCQRAKVNPPPPPPPHGLRPPRPRHPSPFGGRQVCHHGYMIPNSIAIIFCDTIFLLVRPVGIGGPPRRNLEEPYGSQIQADRTRRETGDWPVPGGGVLGRMGLRLVFRCDRCRVQFFRQPRVTSASLV